jgi:hypothetical protein
VVHAIHYCLRYIRRSQPLRSYYRFNQRRRLLERRALKFAIACSRPDCKATIGIDGDIQQKAAYAESRLTAAPLLVLDVRACPIRCCKSQNRKHKRDGSSGYAEQHNALVCKKHGVHDGLRTYPVPVGYRINRVGGPEVPVRPLLVG